MDIKVNEDTVVVFDLDDTLYNELDYLKSAYKAIAKFLEPNSWKPLYSNMFSLYRCKLNVFAMLSKSHNIDVESLVEMYRNHEPDINLFDGVVEVFKAVKSKNGKIGIITDGRSKTQRSKLVSLGILDYIDKIIISEEIGTEKPNIANFHAVMVALGGTDYYYIADNLKKDFVAPNALGWKGIALIDNGKNIHFESNKYMEVKYLPQHFIMNFRDLTIL